MHISKMINSTLNSSKKLFPLNLQNYDGKTLLTHKQLEMHRCILSTIATDALVLKHQAISIHSADKIFIVLGQFHTKMSQLNGTIL